MSASLTEYLTGDVQRTLSELLCEGLEDAHILKCIFVAGSTGSGKGRVSQEMFGGMGLKVINQDIHLERLLRIAEVPLADAGTRPDLMDQARLLKDKEVEHYGRRRLGLLIDSTGWSFDRIAKPYTRLRELGYDCYMVFVDTTLETAQRRNAARAASGGRDVPDNFLKDAWYGSQNNPPRYRKLFGNRLYVIDNDNDVDGSAWQTKVAPELQRLARTIMRRPLVNPVGLKWLAQERVSPTLNQPPAPGRVRPQPRPTARGTAPDSPPLNIPDRMSSFFMPDDYGGFRSAPVRVTPSLPKVAKRFRRRETVAESATSVDDLWINFVYQSDADVTPENFREWASQNHPDKTTLLGLPLTEGPAQQYTVPKAVRKAALNGIGLLRRSDAPVYYGLDVSRRLVCEAMVDREVLVGMRRHFGRIASDDDRSLLFGGVAGQAWVDKVLKG